MKRPHKVRLSEKAYLHMSLFSEVDCAIRIVREAEINADVLKAHYSGYDDVHTAVRDALSLLQRSLEALRPTGNGKQSRWDDDG